MILAETIARIAHLNQKDKQGRPYIEHPERIVRVVEFPTAREIAWLHDVLEDTKLTAEDLLSFGVDPYVVKQVQVLTHRREETYEAYIERVSKEGTIDAVSVKLADLRDNMRPGGNPVKQEQQYKPAIEKLKYVFYRMALGMEPNEVVST